MSAVWPVCWNSDTGVSILIFLQICCAVTRADDLRGWSVAAAEPEILLYANKRFPTRLPLDAQSLGIQIAAVQHTDAHRCDHVHGHAARSSCIIV